MTEAAANGSRRARCRRNPRSFACESVNIELGGSVSLTRAASSGMRRPMCRSFCDVQRISRRSSGFQPRPTGVDPLSVPNCFWIGSRYNRVTQYSVVKCTFSRHATLLENVGGAGHPPPPPPSLAGLYGFLSACGAWTDSGGRLYWGAQSVALSSCQCTASGGAGGS